MEDTRIIDFESQAQAMEPLVAHLKSLHWEQMRLVKSLRETREAADKTREFVHMVSMEILAKEHELREVVASHDQSLKDSQGKQQPQSWINMLMCKIQEKRQLLRKFEENLATDMVIIRQLEMKHTQCLQSILMGEMRLQRLSKQLCVMEREYRPLVEKAVRIENELEEERSKSKMLEEENDEVKRQLVKKTWQLKENDRQLEEKDRQLEEKDRQLEENDRQLEEKGRQLEEKDRQLEEKDRQLEEKDGQLEENMRQFRETIVRIGDKLDEEKIKVKRLEKEKDRRLSLLKVGGVLLSAATVAAAALLAGVI